MASVTDPAFAGRLISQIAPCVKIDPATGGVSFSVVGLFQEQKFLLLDLLETHRDIPIHDTTAIARDALFAAAADGLTLEGFVNHATRLEHAYLARAPLKHVLLTQVSVHQRVHLPRVRLNDVTISFPERVPVAFSESRRDVLKHAARSLHAEPPVRYRWVRASVTARTHVAAGDKGLDALQLLLAVWNLGVNRHTWLRASGGKRTPVNSIGLAPVHTLHKPSGTLSTDTWWYEPDYVCALDLERQKMPEAVSFGAGVLRRLRQVPYARDLEDWFRYYGRALGQADWANSYVMLWQALEAATCTSRMNYGHTVKRAAFMFDDAPYCKRVLESLKDCRNDLVHAQSEPTHLETKLYVLKGYVEQALLFHLSHAGDFESPDEAGLFLELPADPVLLRRRLALVEKAARYRSGTTRHA